MAEAPSQGAMGSNPVTKANMKQFLEEGIKKMRSKESREILKTKQQPGQELIKMQRSGWESLGVDKDIGCAQLDKLDELCPDDKEMFQLRNEFVMCAQEVYLQAVEDKRPPTLEKKKPMPRETIIEFFDACNTKMDLPSTHKVLREHVEKTKGMPNQIIIEIQRDMLEVLGFEREHGCAMLSNIGKDFPTDKELHRRFQMWQQKAQMTCAHCVKAAGASVMPNIQNPFEGDPDFEELQPKAREAVAKMTPQERGLFMTNLQEKMKDLMTMTNEAKKDFLVKLPKDDKFEFIKFQILAMSVMQQQMQAQQQGGGCAMHGGGYGGMQGTPPPYPGQTVSTPAQQEMM